jgi:hypothetical protein
MQIISAVKIHGIDLFLLFELLWQPTATCYEVISIDSATVQYANCWFKYNTLKSILNISKQGYLFVGGLGHLYNYHFIGTSATFYYVFKGSLE